MPTEPIRVVNKTGHADAEVRRLVLAGMGRDADRRPSASLVQRWAALVGKRVDGTLDPTWLVVQVRQRPHASLSAGDERGDWGLFYPGRQFAGRIAHGVIRVTIGPSSDYPVEGYSYGRLRLHLGDWREELVHNTAHEQYHLWHPTGGRSTQDAPHEIAAERAALRRLHAYQRATA